MNEQKLAIYIYIHTSNLRKKTFQGDTGIGTPTLAQRPRLCLRLRLRYNSHLSVDVFVEHDADATSHRPA